MLRTPAAESLLESKIEEFYVRTMHFISCFKIKTSLHYESALDGPSFPKSIYLFPALWGGGGVPSL